MSDLKKIAIIVLSLVEEPKAYEGRTNRDIEEEILKGMPAIPYAARVEKVTVLDEEARPCPRTYATIAGEDVGRRMEKERTSSG